MAYELYAVHENPGRTTLFIELASWSRGISRTKYSELRSILRRHFEIDLPSLCSKNRFFQQLTGITPTHIDCCVKGCMAFTGDFEKALSCVHCREPRYKSLNRRRQSRATVALDGGNINMHGPPRKQYMYISIADRLTYHWKDPIRARQLKQYKKTMEETYVDGIWRDFWDGRLCRSFLKGEQKLLLGPRDIAFHLSCDGVQLTRKRPYSVSVFIFFFDFVYI